MSDRTIKIKNMSNGRVGITNADLRFNKVWEGKNAVKVVPFEIMSQLIYDDGTKYLFNNGILYIDNKKDRIDLGLEAAEGQTEDMPKQIIFLDDKQKKRYLTLISITEFKEMIKKLSKEQVLDLADYAIANNICDLERSEIIKKMVGIDIYKAILLNREETK